VERDRVDRIMELWAEREPDLDVSSLEVAGRLLRVAGALERLREATVRRYGLSPADFDVLATLRRLADPDGTNPKWLAESALITTGAMTSRLDRLEAAGHVHRTPDPRDRRGVLVRLTEQGHDLVGAALVAVLDAQSAFLAPLGRNRAALVRGLRTLMPAVDGTQR
jgi:DNA-binding MarR family transcriptional regulator